MNTLAIVGCPLTSDNTLLSTVGAFKNAIGYSEDGDKNPLELPDYCLVVFYDADGALIGKYDCMMRDLMHSSIDTNRNALTFTNKTRSSITPLLLVKPVDGYVPAIAANTFHANIIGRWK